MFFLPAVGSQSLNKIAIPVQQTNCDQRQTKITGRLQMIAGKDSQPTRIKWQGVMYTKLRAEVGDRILCSDLRCPFLWPPWGGSHVCLEEFVNSADTFKVNWISRRLR